MEASETRPTAHADVSYIEIPDKPSTGRVVGKGGRTRMRIERATGCHLDLIGAGQTLEIRGTESERQLAFTIVHCIMSQQGGDVVVNRSDISESCTILEIPAKTTKMVLGRGGEHLHSIEEEAHTIMLCGRIADEQADADTNKVMIFGERFGRRLSQLLIMGLVDSIVWGYFTEPWYESRFTFENYFDRVGDWGTSVRELPDEDEMAYVIGKHASTRVKLMRATGCIVARVGSLLFMSGEGWQRKYAEEYVNLLLAQRLGDDGYVAIASPQGRDDCTIIDVPNDCVAYVTGVSRQTLQRIEETWGVMMFNLSDRPKANWQSFAIFGPSRSRCAAELEVKTLMEIQSPGLITKTMSKHISYVNGFAQDHLPLEGEEKGYIRGKNANTVGKLMNASNAIVQFVGNVCVIAGELDERQRCHDYVGWLLCTMNGGHLRVDASERSDVIEVIVPKDKVELFSRSVLDNFEHESGTLMFMTQNHAGGRCLMICGQGKMSPSREHRMSQMSAERLVRKLLSAQKGVNGANRIRNDHRISENSSQVTHPSRHWKSNDWTSTDWAWANDNQTSWRTNQVTSKQRDANHIDLNASRSSNMTWGDTRAWGGGSHGGKSGALPIPDQRWHGANESYTGNTSIAGWTQEPYRIRSRERSRNRAHTLKVQHPPPDPRRVPPPPPPPAKKSEPGWKRRPSYK